MLKKKFSKCPEMEKVGVTTSVFYDFGLTTKSFSFCFSQFFYTICGDFSTTSARCHFLKSSKMGKNEEKNYLVQFPRFNSNTYSIEFPTNSRNFGFFVNRIHH